ncbi:MAG: hypothetical protein AVDCRST_MAG04-1377, partial [uncultured Acetobacteraceae bacterium]
RRHRRRQRRRAVPAAAAVAPAVRAVEPNGADGRGGGRPGRSGLGRPRRQAQSWQGRADRRHGRPDRRGLGRRGRGRTEPRIREPRAERWPAHRGGAADIPEPQQRCGHLRTGRKREPAEARATRPEVPQRADHRRAIPVGNQRHAAGRRGDAENRGRRAERAGALAGKQPAGPAAHQRGVEDRLGPAPFGKLRERPGSGVAPRAHGV